MERFHKLMRNHLAVRLDDESAENRWKTASLPRGPSIQRLMRAARMGMKDS